MGENFDSVDNANTKLFDIKVFYNQVRMHPSLDYAWPAEVERHAHIGKVAA